MKHPPVSIICTVLNEAQTIRTLLESFKSQTLKATEIIICDGGSTDKTINIITEFSKQYPDFHISLLIKEGNRSIGRNAAIAASKTEVIAITDAGCRPDKNWLEQLVIAYEQDTASVVAGYYKGVAKTAFEEAVIPYVLVMPDKVNPKSFLPATRSMLLEKKVWKDLNGFDESLSHNEDYAFAKKIVASGHKIIFAPKAVVAWFPRKNLSEFAHMIERFAKGDFEAGIVRPKVIVLFVRYIFFLLLLVLMLVAASWQETTSLLLTLFVLYSLWAIWKNGKYATRGWYWLPILQFVADYAVIKGSVKALIKVK